MIQNWILQMNFCRAQNYKFYSLEPESEPLGAALFCLEPEPVPEPTQLGQNQSQNWLCNLELPEPEPSKKVAVTQHWLWCNSCWAGIHQLLVMMQLMCGWYTVHQLLIMMQLMCGWYTSPLGYDAAHVWLVYINSWLWCSSCVAGIQYTSPLGYDAANV